MINLGRLTLLTSIAAFRSIAQGQTANVEFIGTMPATCLVNSTTTGTLTNTLTAP